MSSGERASAGPLLVVDAANVIGSVPDGWWRDRAGAAERLRDALVPVLSLAQIAEKLNQEKMPTASGKPWSRSSVQYALRRWDSEHPPE